MQKIKVKKLHENATFDQATSGSVGYDLTCVGYEFGEAPGGLEVIFLKLGVQVEPIVGTYFELVPRSSFPIKFPLLQVNSPGVIDQDYRGELKMIVKFNLAPWIDIDTYEKYKEYTLPTLIGKKVAQAILRPMASVEIDFVDNLSNTEREDGGFGSTGE